MNCICQDISELEGNEALAYIEDHLHPIYIDSVTRKTLYICPVTHVNWLEDYLHIEYYGGGNPRLRKITTGP